MKKTNKRAKIITVIAIVTVIIIAAILIITNVIKNNNVNNESYLATANANSELVANYIKKGITIGGITGTLESLNTSDATATPEDIVLGKTAYVDGKKITGTKITREILKIGDYVEYTPDTSSSYTLTSTVSGHSSNQTITQESFKWRILSVNNDGTVDLISDKATEQQVYLYGELGYNNGVLILNDICSKLYGNSELNVTARSIKLEDIENKMSETGYNVRNEFNHYGIKYGNTYKIKDTPGHTYYPYLYARENGSGVNTDTIKTDGIEQSDSYYTSPTTETGTRATSLTATQTNYFLNIISENFIDENFVEIIENGEYIIATRATNCYTIDDDVIGFELFVVITEEGKKEMGGWDLLASHASSTAIVGWGLGIRPVVTLNSSIEFASGEGTLENPYKISR